MKAGDLVFIVNDAAWIHCTLDDEGFVSSRFGATRFHEGEPLIVLRIFSARWRSRGGDALDFESAWVNVLSARGVAIINMKAFDGTR